jgi:type IV pilus assembly protein PilO
MALKDLSFNNTGVWPREYKLGFCVLIGVVIVGLAWWLFVRDKTAELEGLERQESELRAEFETKQGRAANLEPLKLQLAQMEQQLQQMLRQLPSKTEMPDLIVDISQTALATGISNELFKPGPEQPKDFYAEKPIKIRVTGSYHQLAEFVSTIAALPRIVTLHDVQVAGRGRNSGNDDLQLDVTARTYRYLDDEELAAKAAEQKRNNNRRQR